MRTPLTHVLVWLTIPASLPAQQKTPDANAPLPAGAVMRLGETAFRPGARVKHLAFSPDGKQLASWGNWLYHEDRLSIWDTATGRETHTWSMPENKFADLAWGPDGGRVVLRSGEGFRIWSFADATGKFPEKPKDLVGPSSGRGQAQIAVAKVPGGRKEARQALTADARRLVTFRVEGTPPAGSVHLSETKETEAGAELKELVTHEMPSEKCHGLVLCRGDKSVVVLLEIKGQQAAVVWDIEKGTVSEPLAVPKGTSQGNHQAIDVSEDGSTLAVGLESGTVKVFDLPGGKERLSLVKHDGPKIGRPWSEVCAIKFVNGGRNILSAGRDERQLVWDANTGAEVAALNGHGSWCEAVALSADGKRAATAGQDSLIRLWDTATWKPILPPKGASETVWRLEVSRDGKYATAGAGDGVHVWELSSGREVRTMSSSYKSGYVVFSPGGAVLAGDAKGGLSLFPIPDGPPKRLEVAGRLLEFTPDGKTLLTCLKKELVIWDWPTQARRRVVPLKSEALSAAISPDSRTAAVKIESGASILLDLETGTSTDLPLGLHWFSRTAGFAPGGRVLCGSGGSSAKQAEAWHLRTRTRGWSFEAPPRNPDLYSSQFYTLSLAVSPDGRRTALAQSDGGLAVYETATGKLLAHFHGHRDGLIAVAWTPDGHRVLTGGGDHQVLVWDVSLAKLAGDIRPLPAADREKAWDQLGQQPAREALGTMAALAADPDNTVALLAEQLKPALAADPAQLDRLFRDLDDKRFAVREKASAELDKLGPGAVAGIRERASKTPSEEAKRRAEIFLARYETEDMTPHRLRYLRALDVLSAINSPASGRLIETLAGGVAGLWETDAAKQGIRVQPAGK